MITNHLHSVSNYATSVFKDRLLPTLSNLNQRIILIVALVLGGLALYYRRDRTIREGQISFWTGLNGPGRKIFSDGETMRGNFKHDELHGQGEISWPDGTHYKGTFKHGIPQIEKKKDEAMLSNRCRSREGQVSLWTGLNGPGKKIFSDGKIMQGNFKADELHGEGEISFPDGIHYKGRFAFGVPIDIYIREGTVIDGKLNGLGKKTLPNGTILQGTFENDELQGEGEILSPNSNGRITKGTFIAGKLQQETFTITSLNGALTQIFKDGQLVGWKRRDPEVTAATALLD